VENKEQQQSTGSDDEMRNGKRKFIRQTSAGYAAAEFAVMAFYAGNLLLLAEQSSRGRPVWNFSPTQVNYLNPVIFGSREHQTQN
jgi:hypothetical protein